MYTKIKLINIGIRHKYTKCPEESSLKNLKKFATKIVRVRKKNSPPEKITRITTKIVPQNTHISVNINDLTNDVEKSSSDLNSGDVGMRMLHRSKHLKVPDIEYDFIHQHKRTVLVKSATSGNKIKSQVSLVPSLKIKADENTNGDNEKLIKIGKSRIQTDLPSQIEEQEKYTKKVYNKNVADENADFDNEKIIKIDKSRVQTDLPSQIEEQEKYTKKVYDKKVANENTEFDDEKIIRIDKSRIQTDLPSQIEEQEKYTKKIYNKNGVTRFNELNMQMLSRCLFNQVFPNCEHTNELQMDKLDSMKKELIASGMKLDDVSQLPDVDIELPAFEGKDVEEHFYNIAKEQNKPYLRIIHDLIEDIPDVPDKWLLQEGWTRYTKDGAECVDYPLEDGMIFDVEICMKEGPLPTLATAVTKDAWYGWVSKSLVEGNSIPVESRSLSTEVLIPMESTTGEHGKRLTEHHKKPKIIVGHNVSFDRRRIKEQYWLNCTGARFVDTMSLHVCVSGLNSYQRAVLKTEKHEGKQESWESVTSLNGLSDVHKLYCGTEIDKDSRNVFVEGSLNEVRDQFENLIKYCARDVVATHEVLTKLFPLFEERFPHPVTLAGMLELGSAYLPVNSNWQRYIEESESTFEDLNYEAKNSLSKRADEVCKLMHNDKYKKDLWMWDQDWSVQSIKMKATLSKAKREEIEQALLNKNNNKTCDFEKYLSDGEDEVDPLEEEFKYLKETRNYLPAKLPHMSGYPAWYRKLCLKYSDENWVPGPQNISTSMQVTPKLLNLTWENYPLHYIRDYGWGFLVPYNNNLDVETNLPLQQLLSQCPFPESGWKQSEINYSMSTLRKDVQKDLTKTEFWRYKKKKSATENPCTYYKGSGIWCDVDIDNCCWFFKLPHKDGASYKVGNPLARDFLNKFSENVLAGLDTSASHVLKIARTMSYWRNNRDRIMSQMVVWLKDECFPNATRTLNSKYMRYGAIIPQVVVSGTLTRRATEATWMTASNASIERVGSELRAMVQAPPGYNIVGADVDSQELWIASVVGDAYCAGIHGATPFGWMTLIGTKSNGTDMHSVTAKAVGISRDHAKVINYARIYGAGQKFAERLLKQFNPSMTEAEATLKSRKMFALTKGKRVYRLKKEYVNDDIPDREYTSYDTYRLAKAHGKRTDEMFQRGRWLGGTESAMFNRLEEIAGNPQPVTPFLKSRLSRALEGDGRNDDKYLPTKINWVVQSGAVDFLHLMMVSMRWLMKDNARFCLSFHDEVRYLVPTKYKYNAALAMHVTNLLTRAFCSSRLGIKDLPMSVAFFASVEVDTVLRKESGLDCKTPSNPHGLENGYGVPPGESLDIWAAMEKSGTSLGPWHDTRIQKRSKIPKTTDTLS